MGSNGKSVRDALLTGGPAGLITALLVQYAGMDAILATSLGIVAGGIVTRGWRLAREQWPVLGKLLGDEAPSDTDTLGPTSGTLPPSS